MNYLNIFYPESNFGGFSDIDGSIIFYIRVNSLINQTSILLDIGCGLGAYSKDPIPIRRDLRIFKGKCRKVIGIDIVEYAKKNPFIDEFHLIENTYWPIADETIDLAICDSVLEHVEKPELFFSECQRVIKPGGYLCIRTANSLGYVGLISRIIPNRFHVKALKISQFGRKENDIFPTYYRCNTVRNLRKLLDKYCFGHCVYGYEAEPRYLDFSRFFYWLGTIHQKFMPNILKLAIFVFAKKIGSGPIV